MPESLRVLDTDHVSLHQQAHPSVVARLVDCDVTRVVVTIVTYEEVLRGRLAVVHRARQAAALELSYLRLHEAWQYFRQRQVLPFDGVAIAEYLRLREDVRRIGAQDLKIAAIALTRGAVVVTRNRQDFGQVPGLVIEDWTRS